MASNDTFNEYFTIALGCRKLEVNTICINTHISGPPRGLDLFLLANDPFA
jgi:hypothetical protein